MLLDAVRRGKRTCIKRCELGVYRLPAALYSRWRCSGRRGREFKAPRPAAAMPAANTRPISAQTVSMSVFQHLNRWRRVVAKRTHDPLIYMSLSGETRHSQGLGWVHLVNGVSGGLG
jgi:hypothetical protein